MKILIADIRHDVNVYYTYANANKTDRLVADVFLVDGDMSVYQTVGLVNLSDRGDSERSSMEWAAIIMATRGFTKGSIIDVDASLRMVEEDYETFTGFVSGNYRDVCRTIVDRKVLNEVRKALIGKKRMLKGNPNKWKG